MESGLPTFLDRSAHNAILRLCALEGVMRLAFMQSVAGGIVGG